MQNCFLLCGAATAGLFLMNTASATAQTAAVPSIASQAASAWAKSVKITAVAVPETDESALLGLNMWRFAVTAPKPAHQVNMILEVQSKGKLPQGLLVMRINPQFGWPLNKRLNFFVGEYMPSGDHLEADSKVKYLLKESSFRPTSLLEIGGNTSSSVVDNPFAGRHNWELFGAPEQRHDGSFALIACGDYPDQSDKIMPDAALVFRVEEESN